MGFTVTSSYMNVIHFGHIHPVTLPALLYCLPSLRHLETPSLFSTSLT